MKALPDIPVWMKRLGILLGLAALIPPLLVARARVSTSESPRIHIIPDMDNQEKFKAQSRNDLFRDGRAMRPPVAGTVARDGLEADSHLYRGLVDDKWAETFPMPVTPALLERGRARFNIYCAVCHGLSGYGDGPIAVRAEQLQLQGKATWVPPTSYHEGDPPTRPVGHLFNTITNGIRNMPAYGDQIPPEDRWAIVAYVKALMKSQAARLEDVEDPAVRDELRRKRDG
jgi:mono/diheme cytochrome c family protein